MRRTWLRGRENVHKRYLIHVAGHNLGLLMRLLIGAGTPKEAVARGWYFFVLLRTTDGATYAAILEVFVENSAGPALIVFTTGCDHCLDGTATSSTGCSSPRCARRRTVSQCFVRPRGCLSRPTRCSNFVETWPACGSSWTRSKRLRRPVRKAWSRLLKKRRMSWFACSPAS